MPDFGVFEGRTGFTGPEALMVQLTVRLEISKVIRVRVLPCEILGRLYNFRKLSCLEPLENIDRV